MQDTSDFVFGPFRLAPEEECLWRGNKKIRLAPKAFAVLHYLLTQPGRLVTKDELFQTVWPDTVVGDAALTFSVGEIRRALGDKAKNPQFIETVHRRGYRFVSDVQRASGRASVVPSVAHTPPSVSPTLVGREKEFGRLQEMWVRASTGERQVTFVTGEAGIGKTTLLEAFAHHVQQQEAVWIGQGQCIEQYGAGEAYLPILDALGRLCRGQSGAALRTQLAQHAPTWLAQMPSLLTTQELEEARQRSQGATTERMLRELVEAFDRLTAEKPFLLILEDLHWSDHATLDLLGALARRREPARLHVIGDIPASGLNCPQPSITSNPTRTVVTRQ